MSLEQFEKFFCPHCGQINELVIDMTGGSNQSFVVDCEICCAPIAIRLKIRGEDVIALDVKKEND